MEYEVTCNLDAMKLGIQIEAVQAFGIKDIDDTWTRGEYGLAVLKASITVETVLFHHLLNALSSNRSDSAREKIRKAMEKWTLGNYIGWCKRLELFKEDELQKLESLVKERNTIAHERGYIERGKTDPTIKAKWEEVLNIAREFIQKHGTVEV